MLRDGALLIETFAPRLPHSAAALRHTHTVMVAECLRYAQPLPEGFRHYPVAVYAVEDLGDGCAYTALAYAPGKGGPPLLVRKRGARLPAAWDRLRDPAWFPVRVALQRCGAAWVTAETLDAQGWPATAPAVLPPEEAVEVRALSAGPLRDLPFPGRIADPAPPSRPSLRLVRPSSST